MDNFAYSFVDASGKQTELKLDVTAYKAANKEGLSLRQYVNRHFPTSHPSMTTFDQLVQSAGLFVRGDNKLGIRPPTLAQVLDGGLDIKAGAIIRPDGADRQTVSGRLLYPEVLMAMVESELRSSDDKFLRGLDAIVAQDISVTGAWVDQPVINVKEAEVDSSMPVGQLTEPPIMISFTTAARQFRIPTYAVGLTFSDEAQQNTTLDVIAKTLEANTRARRINQASRAFATLINGDTDTGEAAVSVSQKAVTFDSSIAAAGVLTHKAWVKFLWADYKKLSVDWMAGDIDCALAIQNRTGRPTTSTDNNASPRINAELLVDQLGMADVGFLPLDTSVLGANTMACLDSRYGVQRVTNVSASYSAIEEYVMRKATSLRLDWGWIMRKLYPDAWKMFTLTL